ncbi:MAG: HEPN domain-containing protein [Defluviitaleaceae bacterium]|nr:HEPN domain-containing protein [Defluviitaleaceae bacterium]
MNSKTDYWLEMCDSDLVTAKAMLDTGQLLWMGFICHLVAEKALKAVIVEKTNETPPKTHDLRRLALICDVFDILNDDQKDLLKKLMPLHIEARYPEYKEKIVQALTIDYCKNIFTQTEVFLRWIKQLLEK